MEKNPVMETPLADLPRYPLRSEGPSKGVSSAAMQALSLGEVRKCLNQIRRAGDRIRPEHLLYNGWSAGAFALAYLIGHHKRRVEGYGKSREPDDLLKRA